MFSNDIFDYVPTYYLGIIIHLIFSTCFLTIMLRGWFPILLLIAILHFRLIFMTSHMTLSSAQENHISPKPDIQMDGHL